MTAPRANSEPPSRRSALRRAARVMVSTTLVIALVVILYQQRTMLVRALDMSGRTLVLLVLTTLITWSLTTAAFWSLLRMLQATVGPWALFLLHLATGLLNHLPLRVGMFYRARYLKREAGLSYAHFGSLMYTYLVLMVLATGVVGGTALFVGFSIREGATASLFTGFVIASALGLAPVLFRLPRLSGQRRWARLWNNVVYGTELLATRPQTTLALLGINVLSIVVNAFQLDLALAVLGVEPSVAGCLVMGGVSRLALLVGLTPAGLGLQEFSIAGCAAILGIPLEAALIAGALIRVVILALYVLAGFPALTLLRPKTMNEPHRSAS